MTKNEIYRSMQAKFIEITGVKVGSTVKINGTWERGDHGFEYPGVNNDGKTVTITSISGDNCYIASNGTAYPYFVLEVVNIEPEKQVVLNNRTANVTSEGITCGCLKMTKAEAEKAVKAFKAFRKMVPSYSFSVVIEGTTLTEENVNAIEEALK